MSSSEFSPARHFMVRNRLLDCLKKPVRFHSPSPFFKFVTFSALR